VTSAARAQLEARAGIEMAPQLNARGSEVGPMAFSSDGKHLLVARGADVEVWEVATGLRLRVLSSTQGAGGGKATVAALAFTAKGRALSVKFDRTFSHWDIAAGTETLLSETRPPLVPMSAYCASPGGRFVLFADGRGMVRDPFTLWNVERSAAVTRFGATPSGMMASCAIDDEGRAAVTTTHAGEMSFWRLSPAGATLVKNVGGGRQVAMSADRRVVSVDGGGVTLWDGASGQRSARRDLEQGRSCAFVPGDRLACIGDGVTLWRSSKTADEWHVRDAGVLADIVASPDGRVLAVRSARRELGADVVLLLDSENGATLRELGAHVATTVSSLALDDDVLVAAGAREVITWDLRSLGRSARSEVDGDSAPVVLDSRRVWKLEAGRWRLIELASGKVLAESAAGLPAAFSADGARIALWDQGQLVVREVKPPRELLRRAMPPTLRIALDAAGKRVLVVTPDGRGGEAAELLDVESKKGAGPFALDGTTYGLAFVAEKGSWLRVSGHVDRKTMVVRYRLTHHDGSGQALSDFGDHRVFVESIATSRDGRWLVTGGVDNLVRVWDVARGTLRTTLRGHRHAVTAVAIHGERVVSASRDGTLRLWRLEAGRSVALASAGSEWLIYDDGGFFDASRHGGALAAVVRGARGYHVDQYAAGNRPDRLLELVGLGSPELRNHYRARYLRRKERLGLADEAPALAFARAPEARIASLSLSRSEVTIELDVDGGGAELMSYNVFANDVPLLGMRGSPVGGASRLSHKLVLSGPTKIEVSVTNRAGVESLRDVRHVVAPPPPRGDLYLLAFGVSRYKKPAYRLRYAHKDAADLGAVLERATGERRFGRVHVKGLYDDQVTVDAIRASKQFFAQAGPHDTVVLFVAGHGIHDRNAAADYYFITHESDAKRLRDTAAPFELIEDLLQGIQPRRKLFLLDTCESGDEDDAAPAAEAGAATRGLVARGVRALTLDAGAKPRPYLADRERFIYNDLVRRSGAVVVSSSRGSELSYERDDIQNGVFTEELLKALTSSVADKNGDGALSSDELRRHLASAVAAQTSGRQNPVVDRDNLAATITLPLVPEAADVVARSAEEARRVTIAPPAPPKTPLPSGCACRAAGAAGSAPLAAALGAILALLLVLRRRAQVT
jgi:MYXO-CTERM domain-containing protein